MIISITNKQVTLHKFYKILIYKHLQKIKNLQKNN